MKTKGQTTILQVFSIVVFATYLALFVYQTVIGIEIMQLTLLRVLTLFGSAVAGLLAADLASGLVHFLADNFGTEHTWFFGSRFIKPFRVHHDDPKEMTRHNFFEINGHNALIALLVLIPAYYLLGDVTSFVELCTALFVMVFLTAILLTNQIHAWAHADDKPAFVRFLQNIRLILSPTHHQVHHTSPHDTYYCITTGWLNRLLERTGIFKTLVAWVKGK